MFLMHYVYIMYTNNIYIYVMYHLEAQHSLQEPENHPSFEYTHAST